MVILLRLYVVLFNLVEAVRFLPFTCKFGWRFTRSPYRIANAFAEARGEPSHTYGETPLHVFQEIAKRSQLKPHETFVDLGCGRGRGALFLHHRFHCRAIGLDKNPEFIARAVRLPGIDYLCQDYLKAVPDGDLYFLNNPFLQDEEIEKIATLVPKKVGTKWVTVSFGLCATSGFSLKEKFTATFPWGRAEVFIHECT